MIVSRLAVLIFFLQQKIYNGIILANNEIQLCSVAAADVSVVILKLICQYIFKSN